MSMQNLLLAQCRWKIPFVSPFPNLLRSRSETVTQRTQETAKETTVLPPPFPPPPPPINTRWEWGEGTNDIPRLK